MVFSVPYRKFHVIKPISTAGGIPIVGLKTVEGDDQAKRRDPIKCIRPESMRGLM